MEDRGRNVYLIDVPEWNNTQTVKELLIQVVRTKQNNNNKKLMKQPIISSRKSNKY